MDYHGNIHELEQILDELGIEFKTRDKGDFIQITTNEGSHLEWFPRTGELRFGGPNEMAVEKLREGFQSVLGEEEIRD